MGVHYERGLIGRIREAGLKPVTIAIGSEVVWQGGVDTKYQVSLMGMLQECEEKFPVANLPAPKSSEEEGAKETSSESATKQPEVADKKDDMRQHKKNRRETLAGQTGAEEGNR